MDDVNDQAMGGGSEGQGSCSHQQSDHMEEVRQVGCHIQRVIKREHEHVTSQDGDIIPHQVLLQSRSRRQARLVNYLAHSSNHLKKIKKTLLAKFRTTWYLLNQPL